VVFLVLSEQGKYAHSGPELRKLLEGVEAERPTKDGRLDELIVVAEEAFLGKKNLMDVVRERRLKARGKDGPSGPDPEGAAPFYSTHAYRTFVHVVPEHVSVAAHTILTDEGAKSLLATLRMPRSSLGVLYTNDAPAVWIGAREGQIVEVVHDSQTASKGYTYLRVELGGA
jgi:DNA-directed RNA polymerase subunit H (RpoH/RPB5)